MSVTSDLPAFSAPLIREFTVRTQILAGPENLTIETVVKEVFFGLAIMSVETELLHTLPATCKIISMEAI